MNQTVHSPLVAIANAILDGSLLVQGRIGMHEVPSESLRAVWKKGDLNIPVEDLLLILAKALLEPIPEDPRIKQLEEEVLRLRAGRLTPEEFQELCHNLHEAGRPITREQFAAGCLSFQEQLFGHNPEDPRCPINDETLPGVPDCSCVTDDRQRMDHGNPVG